MDAAVQDRSRFALDNSSGANFTHDAIALLFSLLQEVIGRHDPDIVDVVQGAGRSLAPDRLARRCRRRA